MQVWNLLHAARWKHRTQKSRQKSPSGHHRTTLSGYIFATKAHIDNRKKSLLSSNMSSTCPPQYGELRLTSGWDRLTSLGTPAHFNWFRVLAALLHGSFAALNRGRHLYSSGRPSRWALAHISSMIIHLTVLMCLQYFTRSSAVAERTHNTLSQLKSSQLLHSCTNNHILKGLQSRPKVGFIFRWRQQGLKGQGGVELLGRGSEPHPTS